MKLIYQLLLNGGNTLQVLYGSLKPQCLCLMARIQMTMDNLYSDPSTYLVILALCSPCQEVWHRFFSIKWCFQTLRTVFCIIILPWKPQAMLVEKRHPFGISQWYSRKTIWRRTLKVRCFPKRTIYGRIQNTKLPQPVILINLSMQLLGAFSTRMKKLTLSMAYDGSIWGRGSSPPTPETVAMGEGNRDLKGVYHNSHGGKKQDKTQSLDTEQCSGKTQVEDEDIPKKIITLEFPTYLYSKAREFRYSFNN